MYNPGTNAWTSRAAMPDRRASSNGAGVINGIIYVPGGHNGDGIYTKSLYAYNPSTNAWSTKAAMPAAIGCGGSGVLGSKLYVYGTCGPDGTSLAGLYAYDPVANRWGSRITAPVLRFPAIAAVNGKLYLAGGQDHGSPSNALSVYDPATGKWTTLPVMGTSRYSATATSLNGLLYVTGGYNGSGFVGWAEVYNPATATWRTVTFEPTGSASPGSGAISGKIYVVGGQADATVATNLAYTP
jgi:N-acetylneuraminic acid mutarotase